MSTILARQGWPRDASTSIEHDDRAERVQAVCRLYHQHAHTETGRDGNICVFTDEN